MGSIEKSHQLIHQLVDEGRVFPHLVSVWGHLCHHFDECRAVISLGESLVSKNDLDKSNLVKMHYTLGRLYDKAGEYDAAFGHYHHANTLLPENFDRRGHQAMIDSLIECYSRDAIGSLPRSHCQDRRPVFILGMPRSGSSLLEQILSSHSEIYGAGELGDIKNLAKELFRGKEEDLPDYLKVVDKKKLDTLGERYLNKIDSMGMGAKRITDKMPANFLWLGLIWQLFPQARVIHCRRDPRDTCLSIYFQQFTKGHSYASDLGDLAFYYRQYERLMEHWRQVLDIPVMEVEYAQLVGDLEGHARKLIRFLDLEWEDRCLEYYKSERITATASWDQVRQPVHMKSVARWQGYRSYLGALLSEFGDDQIPLPLDRSRD
jgi:tetratricopeptide (TPR) repeat protein